VCWFRKAATASCSSPLSMEDRKRRQMYQAFALLFSFSQIQGVMAILSHSMIDVNDSLEVKLIEWNSFLMRMNVFGTPFLLVLPSLIGWKASIATVVPTLAYCINQDILTFATVPGIVVSSLAMVAVLSRSRTNLPFLFKLGWVILAAAPTFVPNSSTDEGHMHAAICLNFPLALMVYGLHTMSSTRTGNQSTKEATIKQF
jgi:hypothetical protein